MMMCIPKGVYKRASHNPNSMATPSYSIVEDLARMLCAMSALEVLHIFPAQRTAFLVVIRETDSSSLLTMNFDAIDVKLHLPYHVAFHIDIVYAKNIIRRTVVYEGASTCITSFSCWKVISSLELPPSLNLLTAFDERSFRPHRIISSFSVQLGGKSISIEVEVFDMPLDYNLLLGRICTYAMTAII